MNGGVQGLCNMLRTVSPRNGRRSSTIARQPTRRSGTSYPLLRHASLTILALWLFATSVVNAADFSGSVVSVLDGDTIEVLHNQHPERIRLSGIDCPEKAQAYGQKAKHAASALVFGREVTLQTHGKDKYRRTLADVILPHGTNVNHELVRGGWCWWYRKYAPGNTTLQRLEAEARESKMGLWVDPHPVPPWEWRKSGRY